MNVKQLLQQRGIPYEDIPHYPTYQAQRLAEAVAVSGYEVAKTVLLRVDGKYMLAVLPAPKMVDLEQTCRALHAQRAELVSEEEFKRIFPDCEIGAIPPFGSQYDLPTLVDEALAQDEMIVFTGNTHDEAFRIKFTDYQRLENPRVVDISYFGQ
jgi:Ala-tRNA(Pro) deacylase